ncbi:MAG: hypothetical protein MJ252_09155 [archaeon]|nr:hypothetical protein [archaeon]
MFPNVLTTLFIFEFSLFCDVPEDNFSLLLFSGLLEIKNTPCEFNFLCFCLGILILVYP